MRKPILASLALVLFAADARADEPSASENYTVQVALVEKNGDTFSAVVPVTEHGCSFSEARHGGEEYKLKVCRGQDGPQGAAYFSFEIQRARPDDRQGMQVRARPPLGQPTLIGKLAYADGSVTEVRATVTR